MADTLQGVAPRWSRFRQAHADCAVEMSRLSAEDVLEVDLDVFEAVTTVLCGLPMIHMMKPLITQTKGVDRARIDGIERYALATAFLECRIRALRGENLVALHRIALGYQSQLCRARDYLPPDVVSVAAPSQTLAMLGHDLAWRALRAQHHVGPQVLEVEELEPTYRTAIEAGLHAELLTTCLEPPEDVTKEQLQADLARAFTLLIHAYEPASEAVRKLPKGSSELDALARSYALSCVAEAMGPEALRFFEPGGEGSLSN